jgi:hypothetical protein
MITSLEANTCDRRLVPTIILWARHTHVLQICVYERDKRIHWCETR